MTRSRHAWLEEKTGLMTASTCQFDTDFSDEALWRTAAEVQERLLMARSEGQVFTWLQDIRDDRIKLTNWHAFEKVCGACCRNERWIADQMKLLFI